MRIAIQKLAKGYLVDEFDERSDDFKSKAALSNFDDLVTFLQVRFGESEPAGKATIWSQKEIDFLLGKSPERLPATSVADVVARHSPISDGEERDP